MNFEVVIYEELLTNTVLIFLDFVRNIIELRLMLDISYKTASYPLKLAPV